MSYSCNLNTTTITQLITKLQLYRDVLIMEIDIIGAGFAGSEAAWQLAERGHKVILKEMRPKYTTPAHKTNYAAEMVCSNSFKSNDPNSATGILKAELKMMNSLILESAKQTKIPAGNSLAVDRLKFAQVVTNKLRSHPNICFIETMVDTIDCNKPTIIATGPLTSSSIMNWLSNTCGHNQLFFYDAIAPIVEEDSIDRTKVFQASRYNKGNADFLNCPLDKDTYNNFINAILVAERAKVHDFDIPYFESCLPIEVMAERGRETLRYGPMKPVGLINPKTNQYPYAVVQLRQDDIAGDYFNLVGFQTRLSWSAQKQIFRLIPGLQNANFIRLGSMHRNTYIMAPMVIDSTLMLKSANNVFIAGQLSGVEGYLESTIIGAAAALSIHQYVTYGSVKLIPRETMTGSIIYYITNASIKNFTPINAMIGLLPQFSEEIKKSIVMRSKNSHKNYKYTRNEMYKERALNTLENFLHII